MFPMHFSRWPVGGQSRLELLVIYGYAQTMMMPGINLFIIDHVIPTQSTKIVREANVV